MPCHPVPVFWDGGNPAALAFVSLESRRRVEGAMGAVTWRTSIAGAVSLPLGLLASCGSGGSAASTENTTDTGEYATSFVADAVSLGTTEPHLTAMHGSCDDVAPARVVETPDSVATDIPTPRIGTVGPNGEKD
jgi:hypothetical protein